jgi:hypothetical protein
MGDITIIDIRRRLELHKKITDKYWKEERELSKIDKSHMADALILSFRMRNIEFLIDLFSEKSAVDNGIENMCIIRVGVDDEQN